MRVLRIGIWTLLALDLAFVTATGLLLLVGIANPFVRTVSIHNATDESIRVTPVGHFEAPPERWPLVLWGDPVPRVHAGRSGRFLLEPGESLDLPYDDDDVHLSEVVVETSGRPPLALAAAGGARSHDIADLSALSLATPEMIEAVARSEGITPFFGSTNMLALALLLGAGLLCAPLLALLGWIFRPRRPRPAAAA